MVQYTVTSKNVVVSFSVLLVTAVIRASPLRHSFRPLIAPPVPHEARSCPHIGLDVASGLIYEQCFRS